MSCDTLTWEDEASVVETDPEAFDVLTVAVQGPTGPPGEDGVSLPAYTVDDIGKVLGVISDGAGGATLGWVVQTGGGVSAPVADFSATPTAGPTPLSVAFTDESTNTPTGWAWERDDGGGWEEFSTDQNPTTIFTTGTWDVRLTASNAGGSDGETKSGLIVVTSPPPAPGTPSLDFSDADNSMYYGSLV